MSARHSQIARLDLATYSRHLLWRRSPTPSPTPFFTLYVLSLQPAETLEG